MLEWIERRLDLKAAPAQLADLAATITGDPKALNHGTSLGTLVLRALASGLARPAADHEDRRDLWDRSGIIVDDLASRVLVLNLPRRAMAWGSGSPRPRRTGRRSTSRCSSWSPCRSPIGYGQHVHACENPVVLRRAAAELGVGAAADDLRRGSAVDRVPPARQGITGGRQLSYHGDFDWPGVSIAGAIIARTTPALAAVRRQLHDAVKKGADQVDLAGPRSRPRGTRPWPPR